MLQSHAFSTSLRTAHDLHACGVDDVVGILSQKTQKRLVWFLLRLLRCVVVWSNGTLRRHVLTTQAAGNAGIVENLDNAGVH